MGRFGSNFRQKTIIFPARKVLQVKRQGIFLLESWEFIFNSVILFRDLYHGFIQDLNFGGALPPPWLVGRKHLISRWSKTLNFRGYFARKDFEREKKLSLNYYMYFRTCYMRYENMLALAPGLILFSLIYHQSSD